MLADFSLGPRKLTDSTHTHNYLASIGAECFLSTPPLEWAKEMSLQPWASKPNDSKNTQNQLASIDAECFMQTLPPTWDKIDRHSADAQNYRFWWPNYQIHLIDAFVFWALRSTVHHAAVPISGRTWSQNCEQAASLLGCSLHMEVFTADLTRASQSRQQR